MKKNCSDPEANGEYCLIERTAKYWKVFCDVGAWVGLWSEKVLEVNPHVEIHAFEPAPDTYSAYTERFAGMPNVHCYPVAVSDFTGEAMLYLPRVGGGHSLFELKALRGGRPGISVPCIRLVDVPELADRTIDFLKIDTNGYDFRLLKAAEPMLRRKQILGLLFKYGTHMWDEMGQRIEDAHGFFTDLGYSFGMLSGGDVRWMPKASDIPSGDYYSICLALSEQARTEWGGYGS